MITRASYSLSSKLLSELGMPFWWGHRAVQGQREQRAPRSPSKERSRYLVATGLAEPRCWQRYLHSEKKISTPLLGSKKKSKFHERSQQITAAQAPWSV